MNFIAEYGGSNDDRGSDMKNTRPLLAAAETGHDGF